MFKPKKYTEATMDVLDVPGSATRPPRSRRSSQGVAPASAERRHRGGGPGVRERFRAPYRDRVDPKAT